jgi:hypothetical protein
MPLCCATLHITIRSCNEEGPVEGADITVTKPSEVEGDPPVVVGNATTNDTGTVTFLVGDEGTYFIEASYNDGFAYKTVVAECGVNDVEVLFAATDKVCVLLDPKDYIGPSITVTVSKDGVVVDSCSLGTSVPKCCVSIPGPGTYTLSTDDPSGTFDATEIVVHEDDCGDKTTTLHVPVAGQTCEPTITLWLCGCPAAGFTISVTLPSGRVVAGSTDLDGVATFIVPEGECDDFAGSSYSIDLPGTAEKLTGTVTGDGMMISVSDPPGTWCVSHNEPCFGTGPATLTAVFNGFGGTLVNGVTTTLNKSGVFTWESGCLPYQSGFQNLWIKLTLTIDPKVVRCTKNYAGQIVQGQFLDAGCTAPITAGFYTLDGASANMCPVYGSFTGPPGREIEIFP